MEQIMVRALRAQLHELDQLSGQTARRFDEIVGRFEGFLQAGFDIADVSEIAPEQAEAFIRAKVDGADPSVATMHLRRSALRMLFQLARQAGVRNDDPTLDIVLPARSCLSTRPLDDDEIVVGRSFSLHSLTATRHPASWALAEATARTSELPYIIVDDLDIDNARVWLHGSSKCEARWGLLDEWGLNQLKRRARSLKGDKRLIYRSNGSEEDKQRSCCDAITTTLVRAGLSSEPDVRPASIAAWAGRRVFEETASIEEAARRLGMRSLDTAAHFIAHDWRTQ